MFKNYLIFFLLLLLTNCSAPGTALLGPVFTGATTKSAAQASISFTTNQIVRKIHESSITTKNTFSNFTKKFENLTNTNPSKTIVKFHN
jgi:hypothetical protein